MQKVINVLAVLSFVGTAGIVGGGTVVVKVDLMFTWSN